MLDFMLNVLWTLVSVIGIALTAIVVCIFVYLTFRFVQILKEDFGKNKRL